MKSLSSAVHELGRGRAFADGEREHPEARTLRAQRRAVLILADELPAFGDRELDPVLAVVDEAPGVPLERARRVALGAVVPVTQLVVGSGAGVHGRGDAADERDHDDGGEHHDHRRVTSRGTSRARVWAS